MNNFLLIKIAWRNIWRQPLRSFVVIGAVAIGIWSLVFLSAYMNGVSASYIETTIRTQISHIQIHNPSYRANYEAKYFIENADAIITKIKADDRIEAVSMRSFANGMLSAANGNAGMRILGILPQESSLTFLDKQIVEGNIFDESDLENRKVPILVSKRTAKKLKLKLRSNTTLQFQGLSGDARMGCKVVGIFESNNSKLDLSQVYIPQQALNRFYLGFTEVDSLGNIIPPNIVIAHEFAMIIKDFQQLDTIQKDLKKQFPDLAVENYLQIAPDVALMETQIKSSSAVIMVIIMLALVFGIINTMLMAVLERYRELGMMMAVGMKRTKIFLMIVYETIFLGAIGAPLGMLLGAITVYIASTYGIDMSSYSEGMQNFGIEEIIRPRVDLKVYYQSAFGIFITTVLASIYPALRAIGLNPMEAMRKL